MDETTGRSVPGDPTPAWRTRALPLTLAALLLVGLLALLVPGGREQLALSFSRRSDPYVELYLTDPDTARGCPRRDGSSTLDLTVASHLDEPTGLRWRVTVTGAGSTAPTDRVAGDVATRPGGTAQVAVDLRVPRHTSYDVLVVLVGRTERLRLHCDAQAAR